jgi:HPt (histidine-containing phosphotransfer) domain-containing protein
VIVQVNKLQQTNEEIKDRARTMSVGMGQGETPEKMRELQDLIKKYEAELKSKATSEENNREILNTLRQQTQLLSK